jgi:hypothetical protein
MRSILFFVLLLPFFATAQINRSAREFAGEQIKEYVTTKLFKGLSYKPVSFGQLRERKEKNNTEIAWAIEHEFEMTDQKDQKTISPKTYKFLFYLDGKMKVLRAETFMSN